jgi:hypothetical protein
MKSESRLKILKDFLEETHLKFPEIKFRCEFNALSFTYIVEVIPFSQFKCNKEYCSLEYDFSEKFESAFPGYMVLFVSEESLTKIKNPILETGYDSCNKIEGNLFENTPSRISFTSTFDNWNYTNYNPLAA